MGPRYSPATESSSDPATSSSLGEFAPRSIIKGVGDCDPGVGALSRVIRLAVGMIAPDKIAPARCKLIQRQRPGKAKLGGDFGRRIRGTGRRFVRRSRRLPSRPVRRVGGPLQGEAKTRCSAGTLWEPKLEAPADSRPPGWPEPVILRRLTLPPRCVEGALKVEVLAV
jgi:hypothetical protein